MYDLVVIGNPAYYENKSMELASGALYAAITASKLGMENVAFMGAVGKELRPRVVQISNEHDIEFFLPDSPKANDFQVSLELEDKRFVNLVGTQREIGIRDVPDEFLGAKMIILSPVLREVHAEFIEWLSNASDSTILLDPRFRRVIDDSRVRLLGNHRLGEGMLSFVDVVKPNRLESKIMTGEDDPFLAVEVLVESGSELGIITLSEEGSIAFDGKDFYQIPAFRIDKENRIGAGDAYLSGFALKMLEKRPISECGAFASAVASLVVESNAGIEFMLDTEEVERRTDVLLEQTTVR